LTLSLYKTLYRQSELLFKGQTFSRVLKRGTGIIKRKREFVRSLIISPSTKKKKLWETSDQS